MSADAEYSKYRDLSDEYMRIMATVKGMPADDQVRADWLERARGISDQLKALDRAVGVNHRPDIGNYPSNLPQ